MKANQKGEEVIRILDTNIISYIIKNKPESVLLKFQDFEEGQLGMSFITYSELLFGAKKANYGEQRLKVIKAWAETIKVLHDIPDNFAERYAETRCDLEGSGIKIGGNDLLIACHALSLDCILVTNNAKEFKRVKGLKIENWVS